MPAPDAALTGDAMVALHERYHHRAPVTAKTTMLGDALPAPTRAPRDGGGRQRAGTAIVTGLSLSLPPLPTASRVARVAVRDHFAAALNCDMLADLELVISELVANSVEHGRGRIQLAVEHSIAAIHGSVTDDGDGFDYTLPDLTSQALRGRGLAIVDALVTHWGVRPGSTQVWFDITLIGSPEPGEPNPHAARVPDSLAEEMRPCGDDRPAHHAHRPVVAVRARPPITPS